MYFKKKSFWNFVKHQLVIIYTNAHLLWMSPNELMPIKGGKPINRFGCRLVMNIILSQSKNPSPRVLDPQDLMAIHFTAYGRAISRGFASFVCYVMIQKVVQRLHTKLLLLLFSSKWSLIFLSLFLWLPSCTWYFQASLMWYISMTKSHLEELNSILKKKKKVPRPYGRIYALQTCRTNKNDHCCL